MPVRPDTTIPLDPSTEVQAAGRIHRLGQTKDVLIKRFVFRDSLEENICKLHTELRKPDSPFAITDGALPKAAVELLLKGTASVTKPKKKKKERPRLAVASSLPLQGPSKPKSPTRADFSIKYEWERAQRIHANELRLWELHAKQATQPAAK